MHEMICPNPRSQFIQLSIDGVQESKSSVVSLDTYSISFNKCRNIYPVKVIKPLNKYKVNEQEHIAHILEDIFKNNLFIHSAIFDKPKRSTAKCAMSASAYYPCEYCECPAQLFISTNASNSGDINRPVKKQLVWPYETRKGKLRTLQSIREIAEKTVENGGPLERHEAKGIVGKSLFLDLPHFHYIKDMPCEYMHSTCLGVVKRLVELTFKVGESRERVTKRKLSDPAQFNLLICQIQVPRECNRRCRSLDFSVFKAQEYRNIVLFMFPIVISTIPETYPEEIKLWYYIVYMVRSCVLPNSEFRTIPDKKIEYACENFYRLYEKTYGKKNCSYSVHVVSSHLPQIRGTQPLTFRSAFKFESFFSEMKKMFVPGTISTTKQILQNCYMKRALEFHSCEKTIFYDCKKKPVEGKKTIPGLENNYLIYTTDEENNHHFFQITEIDKEDPNLFICIKQGKFEFKNSYTPNLDWSKVGVFKLGPTVTEKVYKIYRHEIAGKLLKIQNFLITCPLNVLREQ